jgi:hypothetical protein
VGTVIGFVIGYMLGMRDGRNGSASEVMDAWQTIRKSDEFKALVSGGMGIAGQMLKQGLGTFMGQPGRR